MNTSRIAVVISAPLDSRKANLINTIQMANGFNALGYEVDFYAISPAIERDQGSAFDPSLTALFHQNVRVYTCAANQIGVRVVRKLWFTVWLMMTLKAQTYTFFYCRDFFAPLVLAHFGLPCVVESHAHPTNESFLLRSLCKCFARLDSLRMMITIHPLLAFGFAKKGIPDEKIFIRPCPIDLNRYNNCNSREEIRDRPLLTYCGHLYEYKGISTIMDAAKLAPELDFQIIGGEESDITILRAQVARQNLSNVLVRGYAPPAEIPKLLIDSDLLLLPPSGKHPSSEWTSPVKLTEYCASRRPIVASKIPALEYWVTSNDVWFFEPDNSESMLRVVYEVLKSPTHADKKIKNAFKLAKSYSATARASALIKKLDIDHA